MIRLRKIAEDAIDWIGDGDAICELRRHPEAGWQLTTLSMGCYLDQEGLQAITDALWKENLRVVRTVVGLHSEGSSFRCDESRDGKRQTLTVVLQERAATMYLDRDEDVGWVLVQILGNAPLPAEITQLVATKLTQLNQGLVRRVDGIHS